MGLGVNCCCGDDSSSPCGSVDQCLPCEDGAAEQYVVTISGTSNGTGSNPCTECADFNGAFYLDLQPDSPGNCSYFLELDPDICGYDQILLEIDRISATEVRWRVSLLSTTTIVAYRWTLIESGEEIYSTDCCEQKILAFFFSDPDDICVFPGTVTVEPA